jgi:general secretion pathway protein D
LGLVCAMSEFGSTIMPGLVLCPWGEKEMRLPETRALGRGALIALLLLAKRGSAMLLITGLCLAGCTEHLSQAPSTSPPGNPSPPANPAASAASTFADILNGSHSSDAKPGTKSGSDGRTDPNTQPTIYYGDTSARQAVAAGEARPSGEPRSGVVPAAFVETGIASADGDKFQVTFENAEISAVLRAILGDTLKADYFLDPHVHGKISLSAQRPVSRNQLLLLLETALHAQGVVFVHQDGSYRILPASEAHSVGSTNIGPDAGSPGFGTTALPLENISAEALTKILDGFGAAPGSIRVEPRLNLLIVRGSTGERQWLIDTALAFDVDWMRNQTVGIFPVKSGSPEIVINELNQLADPSIIKFQPIARLNAVLAVSRSQDAIRQVSTWIARLDRQNDYGPRVHVYRLKSADARKVVAVLKEIFGSGGSLQGTEAVAPSGPMPIARGPGGTIPTPSPEPSRLESPASVVRSAEPGAGENALGAAKVRITADVASNAVVVYADLQDYRPIERAIIELDHPVPEVAIQALAAEVTLNDTLNYGVQFYLQSILRTGTPISGGQISTALPLTQTVPGFNFVLGALANPSVVINALRDVTDVKVLSSPSLVVADNQPALLQVGDQVPVTTGTATSTVTTQSAIVNSVSYVDTGVILRVTPHITRTNEVKIDIEQEVSAVEQNSNAQTLTPTISQQKVKSTIVVNNGQTALLAGMISQERNQEKTGIPGAIDIPVVGNLLSTVLNSTKRTELIVFVKPQIIRNGNDAERAALELKRRMPGFNTW